MKTHEEGREMGMRERAEQAALALSEISEVARRLGRRLEQAVEDGADDGDLEALLRAVSLALGAGRRGL